MKKNLSSLIIAALAFSASAQAQGPLDIFRSDATKQKLEQNAPSLRNHLKQRKAALEAWKAVSPRDLKQVTVTANVTAKNRAGIRELRVRDFHYIGDCGYAHGGQDSGVDTPTTAQAVFASDLAESYLNQAALLGIDIDSLTIEIHGRPDTEPTGRVWYPRNFLYTIYIDSPASDAELEKLAVLAEQNSPVATLVKAAVVPQLTIDLKPSPRERKIEGSTLPSLREYIWGKRQALQASKAKAEAAEKARKAAERYHCEYMTNDEIYNCPDIQIVVNLTNVWSHYEVTKAALEHGKHVYCEKMAAESFEDAKELYDLAKEKGLMYAMAPDTFLGGGYQTCRYLIDQGFIGEPFAADAVIIRN